jgi:hypothetical protein
LVLRCCVLLVAWQLAQSLGFAANASRTAPAWDVAGPARFSGTIYEMGSHRQTVLFRFARTARSSGAMVRVERQFTTPDGKLAAVENVFYQSNQLVSYNMKEFQANLSGSIEIGPDPAHAGQSRIRIGYAKGMVPSQGNWQPLAPNTLIDDDLYPFMLAHWDDLMRGESVKFCFISIEWQRTFNFRLVKTGELILAGRTCEQIAMKPVGFFLSQVVNPLIFTVDKASPHMMRSYVGRTTPRFKKEDAWKYLDAETVFDLDQITPAKP